MARAHEVSVEGMWGSVMRQTRFSGDLMGSQNWTPSPVVMKASLAQALVMPKWESWICTSICQE